MLFSCRSYGRRRWLHRELNYRNTINSLSGLAAIATSSWGYCIRSSVVRGDLRLPRFDFPINTFPHWVSPQIRALCGLLRRIAISVAGGEIISHKAWEFWEAASGQSVLENLEAKSDFHNIMDKFFVLQSYRHIYDLSLLWGAFPHISGNLCSWLWYVPF